MGILAFCRSSCRLSESSGSDQRKISLPAPGCDDPGARQERLAGWDRCCCWVDWFLEVGLFWLSPGASCAEHLEVQQSILRQKSPESMTIGVDACRYNKVFVNYNRASIVLLSWFSCHMQAANAVFARADTLPRFNVQYAQEIYAQQPVHNSAGVWKLVQFW